MSHDFSGPNIFFSRFLGKKKFNREKKITISLAPKKKYFKNREKKIEKNREKKYADFRATFGVVQSRKVNFVAKLNVPEQQRMQKCYV